MDYELIFSDHAVNQMFKRNIALMEIREVIDSGEIIENYQNDKPYPSCLILGYVRQRPIHVVLATNKEEKKFVIITAYEPDPQIWEIGFRTKKK